MPRRLDMSGRPEFIERSGWPGDRDVLDERGEVVVIVIFMSASTFSTCGCSSIDDAASMEIFSVIACGNFPVV
jgi:hypothetical protein